MMFYWNSGSRPYRFWNYEKILFYSIFMKFIGILAGSNVMDAISVLFFGMMTFEFICNYGKMRISFDDICLIMIGMSKFDLIYKGLDWSIPG
jgi:hypothetical protein